MVLFLLKNYGINKLIGSAIIAIFSYIIFLNNIKSVTKVNSIVIPILITIIFVVGIKNIMSINTIALKTKMSIEKGVYWLIEAIVYASYNIILLIPVLINIGAFIKNKKQIKIVAILSRNNNWNDFRFCFFTFS